MRVRVKILSLILSSIMLQQAVALEHANAATPNLRLSQVVCKGRVAGKIIKIKKRRKWVKLSTQEKRRLERRYGKLCRPASKPANGNPPVGSSGSSQSSAFPSSDYSSSVASTNPVQGAPSSSSISSATAIGRLQFLGPRNYSLTAWEPMAPLQVALYDTSGQQILDDLTTPVVLIAITGNGSSAMLPRVSEVHQGLASFIGLRFPSGPSGQTIQLTAVGSNASVLDSIQLTVTPVRHVAYTWDRTRIAGLTNLLPTPMIWGVQWGMYDDLPGHAALLKNALDQLPNGHKGAILRERIFLDDLIFHPDDALRNHDGSLQTYIDHFGTTRTVNGSLWWENAVAHIRPRLRSFVQEFHRIGGKIDYLAVHFEHGFGPEAGHPDLSWEDWLRMVDRDPRMDSAQHGLFNQSVRNLLPDVQFDPDVINPYHSPGVLEKRARFERLMTLRRDNYLNQMVYDVFREFFPNIRCSLYFRHEQSPSQGVAEYNGNSFYLFSGAFPASIFGSSQALQYDQDFTHFGDTYYSPTGQLYEHTPFNVFRFAANRARGSILSFPAELTPWIAPKHYSALMGDNRFYEEMLLHSMVAGANEHIFWNPVDIATQDDNESLDRTLKEIERVSDYSELRQTEVQQLASWASNFFSTCAQFDRGHICRVTPYLDPSESPEATVLSESPATFQARGESLQLAGHIERTAANLAFDRGFWVVD